MDQGRLVPDEVVDALVAERFGEGDATEGYILDGYPRNLDQAKVIESARMVVKDILFDFADLVADGP